MTEAAASKTLGSLIELALLSPLALLPTEEFVAERLDEVSAQIISDGYWREPILVERRTLVILDGHHRREFAKRHGLLQVPCILVDYSYVTLEARRDDIQPWPDDVMLRGLQGRPYPPKTTRHTLPSWFACECHFNIEELREPLNGYRRHLSHDLSPWSNGHIDGSGDRFQNLQASLK